MKKITKQVLLAFTAFLLFTSAQATQKPPEVELNHWWNFPGELAALDVIRQAVIVRGGKFTDIKINSWDELRTSTIKQLNLGYPPAVTQWLSGDDLIKLSELGVIAPTPRLWRDQETSKIIFPEIFRDNQHKGKLINIPLGIHVQNSALYNAAIYQTLGLPLPKRWDEFLDQAILIKQAGHTPIALSNESWQFNMVFNTILMEKTGASNFRFFYDDTKSVKHLEKEITEAFATFIRLKAFSDPEQKNRRWGEAARMVGEGKAAMHVMGDFAKSELVTMGLEAGKDFFCALAPGAEGSMIYLVDNFVMLNVREDYLKAGQQLLFDVVLDPEVQAAYNAKKGSIPTRRGVDTRQLDACSQERYNSWIRSIDDNSSRLSGVNSPLRNSFIQSALEKAWNESMSPEQLSRWLVDTIEQSL